MKTTHHWLASRVCDAYYHFVVIRDDAGTRVTFELASREAGHISSRIDHAGVAMSTDVDSRAAWYLDPEASAAWRRQRADGYVGDDPELYRAVCHALRHLSPTPELKANGGCPTLFQG